MACHAAGGASEGARSSGTETPLFEVAHVFPEAGRDCHRIPSIVATRGGGVLAFADRRKGSRADWGCDTDVVLRRSLDGGRTWEPVRIIASSPGICMHGGPAVVDRETGRAFKFYRHRPNEIRRPEDVAKHFERWRRMGYANYVVTSDDDGETWSGPREVGFAFPERHRVGNGVHGVQLRDGPFAGRLIVNAGAHKGLRGALRSFLLYSDDHGETWTASEAGQREGVVVEAATAALADGTVMVNHRTEGPRRRVTIYEPVARAEGGMRLVRTYVDEALPEPFCHASLARYSLASEGASQDGAGKGLDRILFVNPPNEGAGRFSSGKRVNLTMRLSEDDGATWPVSRSICAGPSGYSDTAVLADGTILCLFENGDREYHDRMSVARLNLAWLAGAEGGR